MPTINSFASPVIPAKAGIHLPHRGLSMCKVELRECFKIRNDTVDCKQTVFYALPVEFQNLTLNYWNLTVKLPNLTVKLPNLTVRFRRLANKLWNLTVKSLNLTVRFEHGADKTSYLPLMDGECFF